MFNNLKIRGKLSMIFIIIFIVMIGSVYLVVRSAENSLNLSLNTRVAEDVHVQETKFQTLKTDDFNMLGASLLVFLQNSDEFKKTFIAQDREKLYSLGQDLFDNLKQQHHITHFYFHNVDGTNFLRLHAPNQFGDVIKRITFKESERTKGPGVGIELGKTAFALRFVEPYYYQEELIGYIELGKEIDEFLTEMREGAQSEFATLVQKKYLSEGDWANVVKTKGLENHWDDFGDYLMIDSTSDISGGLDSSISNEDKEKLLKNCFVDINAEDSESGAKVLNLIVQNGKYFTCAGFPLEDASGMIVGAILSLNDVTGIFSSVEQSSQFILVVNIILSTLLFVVFIFLIMKIIVTPLKKVKNIALEIANGNLDVEINVSRKDEIGELTQALVRMRDSLKIVFEEYEKKIK